MGSVSVNVYGSSFGDLMNYSLSTFSSGVLIGNYAWTSLLDVINTERARRGIGQVGNPYIGVGNYVSAASFNYLKNSMLSFESGMSDVPSGTVIYSDHINVLIRTINEKARICTCNCNYCTCNCNYCTCNCNYACTCNCNY